MVEKKVRMIGIRSFGFPTQSSRAQLKKIRKYKKKEAEIIGINREYPYWKENGWRKRGKSYRGYYKTDYGMWPGLIEEKSHGKYTFYIFNPPEALRNNFHWGCFSHKGNGKYGIHFSHKPRDISSGIITVERLIRKLFEQDKKGGQGCLLNDQNIREYVSNLLRRI